MRLSIVFPPCIKCCFLYIYYAVSLLTVSLHVPYRSLSPPLPGKHNAFLRHLTPSFLYHSDLFSAPPSEPRNLHSFVPFASLSPRSLPPIASNPTHLTPSLPHLPPSPFPPLRKRARSLPTIFLPTRLPQDGGRLHY